MWTPHILTIPALIKMNTEQVAFGKGVHHCLGAALSRREMNIGFKVILERMENFRLQDGASEPEFSANALLHGLTGLNLAFDKIA